MAQIGVTQVTVTGVDELEKALKKLPENVTKKIQRSATRKAAKPLLKQAQANLNKGVAYSKEWLANDNPSKPPRTGLTAKTLVIKALKRSQKMNRKVGVRVITDPNKIIGNRSYYGYRKSGGKSFVLNPHWLEFGVPGHLLWGKGNYPLPAQPFMRPAISQVGAQCVSIMRTEILKDIEYEVQVLAMLNKSGTNTKENRKAFGLRS